MFRFHLLCSNHFLSKWFYESEACWNVDFWSWHFVIPISCSNHVATRTPSELGLLMRFFFTKCGCRFDSYQELWDVFSCSFYLLPSNYLYIISQVHSLSFHHSFYLHNSLRWYLTSQPEPTYCNLNNCSSIADSNTY